MHSLSSQGGDVSGALSPSVEAPPPCPLKHHLAEVAVNFEPTHSHIVLNFHQNSYLPNLQYTSMTFCVTFTILA